MKLKYRRIYFWLIGAEVEYLFVSKHNAAIDKL